ncbi:MAG: MotA/TolQ/ExbB proton channel family protein [Calditrichaeota bacterium]|nr:MotA/TolQ/ExbB proton channel family protein [Calditrichota bacterium]
MRGGWLMIPIALSSLVVIALGVGRYLALRRELADLREFSRKWSDQPADPSRYRAAAKTTLTLTAGFAAIYDHPGDDPRAALEAEAHSALEVLETGLGTLATLAAINPLMGFLGTVTGMIGAFMQIQNLGGNVNANVLAGGIWEALVTTAAGLVVGIVALVIHNYLAGMVRGCATSIEQIAGITHRQLWTVR